MKNIFYLIGRRGPDKAQFTKNLVNATKRAVCLILIFSLLTLSVPAAPQMTAESASSWYQNILISVKTNNWLWMSVTELAGNIASNQNRVAQETQAYRDSQVAEIKIEETPKEVVAGAYIPLDAAAVDQNQGAVSGVALEWEVVDQKGNHQVLPESVFHEENPGDYILTVRGAGKENSINITVKDLNDRKVVEKEQTVDNNKTLENSTAGLPRPQQIQRRFDEWDEENINFAREPRNQRGTPPGIPKENSNFNIIAPLLSSPGRGLDLNVNLFYNSRVWSQLNQDVTYDIDKDWPAPGWSVGFGKIINMVRGGVVQTDGDGTKRFFAGTAVVGSSNVVFDGQSTDGSFVKVHSDTAATPTCPSANPVTYLKYPNGITVEYLQEASQTCYALGEPIVMVPRYIRDRNGNQIEIQYWTSTGTNPPGRSIYRIKDTLGRFYNFNYTLTNNRYYLTSIDTHGLPDQNNTVVDRTFVQLSYQTKTLSYTFTGLTPHVPNPDNTVQVLSAIYYPATKTGYWFGDGDSYSSYGMIRKVKEQRNMAFIPGPGGGISAGTTTRERTYSYPQTNSTSFSTIPSFGSVTETWEGMPTGGPATTTYAVNWDADPRTTRITAPDNSYTIEYSYNFTALPDSDPRKPRDGITFKTEFYTADNVKRTVDEIDWEAGYDVGTPGYPAAIPRPHTVAHSEIENGITLTKSTIYDVYGVYNQVNQMREIGYNGTTDVLRKTVTSYLNIGDAPASPDDWRVAPRLIGLPTLSEVFDTGGTKIDSTTYQYDLNPLEELASGTYPPGYCGSLDTPCRNIAQRGNLSKITKYADLTTTPGSSPVSDNRIYDKVGNLVRHETGSAGIQQTVAKYNDSTAYAYPSEINQGNVGSQTVPALLLKTTAAYNFNTGLPLSVTDFNQGLTASAAYNTQTWRVGTITAPTGAYTVRNYDDINRVYTQTQYASDGQVAGKSVNRLNGLGLPFRQETLAKVTTVNNQTTEIYDVVENEYDIFGRTKRTSNPFRSDESANGTYWSEAFYDWAGRVWKTKTPEGSESLTAFNESTRPQYASAELGKTFRLTDPMGRERWYRADADENIAEVIEPNPDGNGSVATGGLLTKYQYDKLQQLTRTEQSTTQNGQPVTQVRKFNYDALGRIMQQKLAEAQATLNSTGTFVGESTGQWSDVFKYDEYSNVTSSTDARGVESLFSYADPANSQWATDPLNRLFKVSYNLHGAANVISSPDVNYAYQALPGDASRMTSVTTSGVSTDNIGYDTFGRVNEKKTVLVSRPGKEIKVNYVYDSLSRVTDVFYPSQYGLGSELRKNLHYDYDVSSRMNGLKVDGASYASNFVFNAFDQVTSVNIGAAGANQINELYAFSPQTGLLQNQKVVRGSTALLDLTYGYQQCSSCSTEGSGQIAKIINNLDRNKDRIYEYDALSRLKKVTGGINQTWSQTYAYDRFGNRTGVTSRGTEAFRAGGQTSSKNEKNKQSKMPGRTLQDNRPPTASLIREKTHNLAENQLSQDTPSQLSAASDEIKSNDENTDAPIFSKLQQDNVKQIPPNQQDSTAVCTNPNGRTQFDFDNDGKADFAVWSRSSGVWTVRNSCDSQTTTLPLGASGNQIAPGDYDGDGKTDQAVWNTTTGVWTIKQSSNGAVITPQWGATGDALVSGDYDGDGKTDIAVWRPSTGNWYIYNSSNGQVTSIQFGGGAVYGDVPVPGDYDGDGKTDIAVWRPSTGIYYILKSSNGQVLTSLWGMTGDVPVPGDYDGDNLTDLAIWRPSTGTWYVLKSSNGQYFSVQFGGDSFKDVLVPADYDGDHKADIAVWRPSTGTWYVLRSSDGGVTTQNLGTSGDIAVPSAYIRRSSAPKNQSKEIPSDGFQSISYDAASNRINTTNFEYDFAGNQTRVVQPDGTIQRFVYDAAGRLAKVKTDLQVTIVTYTYGASRERLDAQEGNETSNIHTFYAWDNGSAIAEYANSPDNTSLIWTKNYIYMGGSLLATQDLVGTTERVQFNHPDSLGTRVITNPADGTSFEQASLPFGTPLDSESSGSTNRRYTSYDRSAATKLDYAVNRFYDSAQGRFTTVDPIKMSSSNLANPQSLNLYAYCGNDPINRTDPKGLDSFDFQWLRYSNTLSIGGGYGVHGSSGSAGTSIWGRIFGGLLGWLFGGGNGGIPHASGFLSSPINTGSMRMSAPPPLADAGASYSVSAPVTTYHNSFNAISDTTDAAIGYGRVVSILRSSHSWRWYLELPIPGTKLFVTDGGVEYDITTAVIEYSPIKVGTAAYQDAWYGQFSGDERAHVIAAALGGGGDRTNIMSQLRSVNRREYKSFEREIRVILSDHHTWQAHIAISVTYNSPPRDMYEALSKSRRYLYRPIGVDYNVIFYDSAGNFMRTEFRHFNN